ncbi:hypothetical protein [Sediminitomix flava]|uniref:Uncharacterized protein n=1 Tax=Sediminitomix flava TaxID=379075 RepID=A0A315ZDF6_SEDFL|nr:hypothetical protein [Sediminitomix flava]PWJ42898.1 hypothetical protein BC781_102444 [Sediminitomix flava]
MTTKHRLLLITMILGCQVSVIAQSIQNLTVNLSDDQSLMTVNYDLLAESDDSETYDVTLYYVTDEGEELLAKSITGDIGTDMKVGTGYKVEWALKQDLERYQGNLSMKVKAVQTYSPVKLKVINNFKSSYKRKKPKSIELIWARGGWKPTDEIFVDLYKKDGTLITKDIASAKQSAGKITVLTPRQKGKYHFALRDSKGFISKSTPDFKVKKGGGFFKTVLVGAALAGGYVVLTGLQSSTEDEPNVVESGSQDLPAPPNF